LALNKQIIPISFGQGIDTKVDVKQQIEGKLRRAVNVVFETVLSARKRNGYDSLLLYLTTGERLEDAKALSKYNNELIVFNPSSLFSFSDSLQKFEQKGDIYNVYPFTTPVLNNSYNHDNLDLLTVENLNVHTYHNTISNDIRYSVQDIATKSLLVSDDVVATGAEIAQVASIQNFVYIVYVSGANLYYKRFNILTPTALSSATLLASNVNTAAPKLDIISGPGKIIIAYNSTQVGANLQVFGIDSAGVASSIVGVTGASASHALDAYIDSSFRTVISYSNGSNVSYCIFPLNLTGAILGNTLVESVAGVTALSSIQTASGVYSLYYQVSAAETTNYYIKNSTITVAGSATNNGVFMRSVGLSSKIFAHNETVYVPLIFVSTLQSTYFVADSDATVVAKWSQGVGGVHTTTGVLPQTMTYDENKVIITSQYKNKLISENGTFYGLLGVTATTLDFDFESPYETAFFAQNLHISGGLLQMYDGDSVVEHGFNVFPETLKTITQDTSVQGSLAPGNYGYKALYRWTDNVGQEHRSATTTDLTVAFASSSLPTGTLATDSSISVGYSYAGAYANGYSLTVTINAPAANPTNTILAAMSGTLSAAVLTITPNDGTNNSAVPVTLTTAELAELINSGTVIGKSITLTDTNFLLRDWTATGGSASNIVAGSFSATLASGSGVAPSGSLATTVPVVVYSRTPGTTKNGVKFTLQVAAAAANPTNTILAVYTGTATNITLTITPNNGVNNGAIPVNLTTAELAQLLTYGAVTGKSVTVTDASTLSPDLRATGGGAQNLADGGEGDGLATSLENGAFVTSYKVDVPTLRLTSKENVIIELYRTEDNGNIYYIVTNINAPNFNNKSVDYITVTDTISDTELISRQPLYTNGGVLDNTAAPATTVMTVHTTSGRLIVANKEASLVQYSKIRLEGFPVEFNDDLVVNIDPEPGLITALSAMDDKIIIFQEKGIQFFSGAGPTNTGAQNLFTDPELVSSDVGCTDPKSVVFTNIGIFFKSTKGIYLLGRDLSLEYIGAPVEAYNGLTITSAKVISDFNQIRFTTSDGDCLVYNYFLKLWATFDNHRAMDAEVVDNQYYYLRTSRELFKENPTSYGDNGSPIKLQLETGWLNMSALQGAQRVYQLMILGDYKSAHTLKISAAFNYIEAYAQTKSIVPTDRIIDATPYGGYSPYGLPATVPYGGAGKPYQARFDFKFQKCQALRILVEDEQSAAGEGLSLSAMTLLVGGKTGLFKIDNAAKYGLE
jgi:hypothetical protein